jgi:hypothetical protein
LRIFELGMGLLLTVSIARLVRYRATID